MILPRVLRVFCCPYCSFVSPAAEQVRSHTVSQHAVQPKFCCPLCQEQLMGRPNLRFHLTHIHNVVSECVERLLLVASTVEPTFSTKVLPNPNLAKARGSPNTSSSFQAPDGPKDSEDNSTEPTSEKKSEGLDSEKEQTQDSVEPEDPNDEEKEESEKRLGGILPCPLCRQRAESFPELREHMENEHPELSPTEVQHLCGPGLPSEEEEEEEEEMEEIDESLGVSGSPPGVVAAEGKQMSVDMEPISTATPSVAHDLRQPVSYRKSTNFALDKFLDPSRPYKCTVCKESFTQKNILLVHYNSVSHLHKMKKASIDPSLPSRTEVTTAQDKPFKCTVCRVSYNQSSTLEIHMRSVLHQTRSRVAKLEAAGHSTPDLNNSSSTSAEKSDIGSKNNPVRCISPKIDNAVAEVKVEAPSTEPVRKGLTMPSLPFVSSQMHLSLDLHRQASLLQSPLFTPPLLPPFPLGPETLMKLQQHQQQLLLPFYLHDLKVNPELGIQGGSSFFSLPGAGSMLIGSGGLMKPPNVIKDEPHRPMEPPSSSISLSSSSLACPVHADSNPASSDLVEQPQCDTQESSVRIQDPASAKEEASVCEKETLSLQLPSDKETKESDKEQATNAMPPPRIPSDVSRTASKALLENFGFELVIQYNEGKQHLLPAHPPLCHLQPAPPRPPRGAVEEHVREKLKCETCGKLFSNMLILKTHEEHVHRRFLPFEALSRYAAQFRKSYDSMYAPKQPMDVQPTEDPHQTSQLSKETPVQIPQLPIPLDFSLCSSFLMPPISLQAVPAALPSMDELMSAATTQVQTGEVVAEPDACENRSPRTRITPEQLKVLWNYFDINNLPSEEKILQMSEHTGLAAKVVKHWFRNRLFKERQQDKDSPYNFSTPPSAAMLPESEETDTQQTPGTELGRPDRWGNRRFSRTKFSDFQFQALQSFFETSAYPKDSEVEKLSQLLGLANRVVVVWFQNARQKARKNAADSPFHTTEKAKELGSGDRCAMSGSKPSTCKKCHLAFPCIFKLIQHLKKCYNDQLAEEDEEQCPASQEVVEQTSSELQDRPSAIQQPPPEIPEVQESLEDEAAPVLTPNDQQEKQINKEVGEIPKSEAAEQVQEEKFEEQPPAMETSSDQPLQEPEKDVFLATLAEETQPTEQTSTSPPPPPPIIPEPPQSDENTNVYSCDQCHVSFASPEMLGKHQSLHILASTQLPGPLLDMPLLMFDHNSSLLTNPLMPNSYNTLPSSLGDAMAAACRKRKLDEDSLSPTESEAGYLGDEPPKDKRLRTTILPEQLEILHRWYMQDSNPTRKMLDRISEEVSLKKRVVQVWFQNTRARERKGQFRCVTPVTSPKPYAKYIPMGKPENLPRSVADTPVGPFLAHRSPSLQMLRDTAAFYYNATGIHHATAPAAPPRGNPSPCQPTPTSQAFIKAEACCASREPATPDPTPAEPADSAAVGTQEAVDKHSGVEEPAPVIETEERNQQASPAPNAPDEARSPGDLSDSSSLADPESPNSGSHRYMDGALDAMGQRRFRTQMSSLQLKIMKACYANYRTPTMSECELLGSEIGLQKRVIQVWFQNARAKEKKAKLQGLPPPMGLDTSGDTPRAECTYCHIKYDFYVSCRSHVFSRQHIARLREVIQKQLKNEIKYYDLAPAAGSSVPQIKAEVKPGTAITTGPPAALNYPPPPLGFQNMSASLPRLAPVLLSGQGPTAPIGGLAPFNPGSASNLLGVTASVPSAVLPVPSHPGLPKTSTDQTPACEFRPDPHTEKENRPSSSPQRSTPQKSLPDTPVLSSITASKNMKTLQAAITGGGGAAPLLGNQFLPFPLPGAPPMFSPQVQGAYFQQLYGMKKGIFPMNPVIPQTIIGLLPNSVVRPEVPKPPEPAPPVEAEEAARASGEELLLLQGSGVSTVDVAHKFLCRRCRVAFDDEAQAVAHQDETCFHRESAPPPQRVPVCTYHCLACQVLVSGTEALGQHLRSAAHKRQALRNNNPTFAKEEANIPHADPSPNPASTSVLLAL